MKIKVHDGKDDKAPSFIQYNRSFACMPSNLKCCCYQEMSAKLLTDEKKEEGKDIGSFVESFYWCHTQFNVVDEEGKVAYHVRLSSLSHSLIIVIIVIVNLITLLSPPSPLSTLSLHPSLHLLLSL